MAPRERIVLAVSAVCFLAAAIAIAALVPNERDTDLAVIVGLVIGYILVERVRFEFGGYYGTAEQLLIVPIALLVPLPLVPLLVAFVNLAAIVPEIVEGSWSRDRFTGRLADCWFCIPPVLVLAALAPGEPVLRRAVVAQGIRHVGAFGIALVQFRVGVAVRIHFPIDLFQVG